MKDLNMAYSMSKRSRMARGGTAKAEMTPPQAEIGDRHEEFKASPAYHDAYQKFCMGGMAEGGMVDEGQSDSELDPGAYNAFLADDHDDEGEMMAKGGMAMPKDDDEMAAGKPRLGSILAMVRKRSLGAK